MDVAFAMMGSTIPIRGTVNPTVLRPFGFSRGHYPKIARSIERDGVAHVPGSGETKHGFIRADDVAEIAVAALRPGLEGVHDTGGPEALSYLDVVRIYERLLGKSVRVKKTPAFVFLLISKFWRCSSRRHRT